MEIGQSSVIIVYCIDGQSLLAALRNGSCEILDRIRVVLKLKVREATVVIGCRLRIIKVNSFLE